MRAPSRWHPLVALPIFYTILVVLLTSATTLGLPSDKPPCNPANPTNCKPPKPAPNPTAAVVTVRHHTLNVTTGTIFQSCDPFASASLVNSSFPGPTIRARAGEILQVRVFNQLSNGANLTMHFHGLSMHKHPIMDGTVMISQWPITPGKYFDYTIPLTAEDKGSYFLHSHAGVQAMTAYAVLIVEDPEQDVLVDPSGYTEEVDKNGEGTAGVNHVYGDQGLNQGGRSGAKSPYKWDQDRVLAVGDWWSYSSTELIQMQLDADPFVWPGSANKLLLNGQSSPDPLVAAAPACDQKKADTIHVSCNDAPRDCTTSQRFPEIHLDYGKTYRLRFIGATSLMYVTAAILKPTAKLYSAALGQGDMEKMSLIEVDGGYIDAFDVDHVELTTGQRYSALYTSRSKKQVAKDGTNGVYWMRIESRWRSGPSMWVKIVYPDSSSKSAAVAPPIDTSSKTDIQLLPKETFGWVTSSLSPLSKPNGPEWWYSEPMPKDSEVTRTVVLDTQQVKFYASGKGIKWAEDGEVYNESYPTPVPYLMRTFLGDLPFPSAQQFSSALYNPTTYQTSGGIQNIIAAGPEEASAAKRRKWAQGYDDDLNMFFAKAGEVIDIVIVNRPSEISQSVEVHPWHMHSKKHLVRTIQPGTFSFQRLESIYSSSNEFKNPIQRDTTVAYASPGAAYLKETVPNPSTNDGGFAVLRYKVDPENAGIFLLHCHIQFHLYMGMATVWTIAPDQLADKAGIYWPKQGLGANNNVGVKDAGKTKGQSNVQGLGWSWFKFGSDVEDVE
ncbi:related to L-ascorbate oxidase precursor [Ustilago trichophora]|uniref:laccase n=1 Tax=Ustilago trichophora TaxID=86804 RepID=A0A5C3EPW8_9BASI|nr:related to L-ascorbate oxidase precursor [Ustilago trichophora]